MGFSGAMLAFSAVSAVSQIGQGYAQKAEDSYNAELYKGKAKMIDAQQEITDAQYARTKGQYFSKSVVNTAGAGIGLQGSSLAVLIDAQTQIGIDQAISKFNSTQEKNYAVAQSDAYKRSGRQAVYSGYSNAFSTMFQGLSTFAKSNQGSSAKKGK